MYLNPTGRLPKILRAYRRSGLQECCFSRQVGVCRQKLGPVTVNPAYSSTAYRDTSVHLSHKRFRV